MAIYFYKLKPPRPTFPADITPAEGAAMERHFAYWGDQLSQGNAVVYGPVADPAGTYGVAIIKAASETEARSIVARDPATTSGLGFTPELHEMPDAVVGGADA